MGLNYTSCKSIYQDFRRYNTVNRKNCILEDVTKENRIERDRNLATIKYDERVASNMKMNLFNQLVFRESN